MFPSKSVSELQTLTLAQYTQLKDELAAQVAQRAANLNGTQSRRKRDSYNQDPLTSHAREKRSVNNDGMKGFPALLKTSHSIYGVFTHNGDLTNSTSCTCSNKPTSKVRKILSTLVAWDEDLMDYHSEAFKKVKMSIEAKVRRIKSYGAVLI